MQPGLSERVARSQLQALTAAGVRDFEDLQVVSRKSLIAGGVHPIAADYILAAQGKCRGRRLHKKLPT